MKINFFFYIQLIRPIMHILFLFFFSLCLCASVVHFLFINQQPFRFSKQNEPQRHGDTEKRQNKIPKMRQDKQDENKFFLLYPTYPPHHAYPVPFLFFSVSLCLCGSFFVYKSTTFSFQQTKRTTETRRHREKAEQDTQDET